MFFLVTIRYEDVLSRLVYWSTINSDSAVQQLHQTAASIRGARRLPRGSLVLIRIEENKQNILDENQSCDAWKFARIAGKAEGSLILLYLNPEESLVVSFEVDRVIPVSPEMCAKFFTADDCKTVKSQLPSSSFFLFI